MNKINGKKEYFLALKNGWGKKCYMNNDEPSYIERLEKNVDIVVELCSVIDPDLYKKQRGKAIFIHYQLVANKKGLPIYG